MKERIVIEPGLPYGYNAWLETKGIFYWRRTGLSGWGKAPEEAEKDIRETLKARRAVNQHLNEPRKIINL